MELGEIKGLGKKRIASLNAVGIFSPIDLVLRFPQTYYEINKKKCLSEYEDGEKTVLVVTIIDEPKSVFVKKGFSYVKAAVACGDENVEAFWFNQRFIAKTLTVGKELMLLVKIKKFKNKVKLTAIKQIHEAHNDKNIVPIYKSITGLPNNVFLEAVETVLKSTEVSGYLEPEVYAEYGLTNINKAIKILHSPISMLEVNSARETISVEELSYKMSCFSLIKEAGGGKKVFRYNTGREVIQEFVGMLSFPLTKDQEKAIEKIYLSLTSDSPVNIMVEGDVGCGKTVVAFFAMFLAHKCGYQSVLMSPTEILAKQHYVNAVKFFKDKLEVQLLTGSLTKQSRDLVKFNIANGIANIVIGTHVLISEDIIYKNLALAITDEQQRFGVKQRAELENKSAGCDKIVMTATPIPRTLALSLYGDLEKIEIRQMPKNKAKTNTRFVDSSKMEDMFNYLHQKAVQKEKTFIVTSRIDDDENGGTSAEEIYKKLKSKFSDVGIGLIHGQMQNKQQVMDDFSSNKISVLVATTVVEVGIDIPEATSIVILDAERYGLSQLHQLRGRVGRGEKESYCFITSEKRDSSSLERLKFFCSSDSGFDLAEYDFFNRGAGDFIGTRQHGETEIKITKEILDKARNISFWQLSNSNTKQKIEESLQRESEEYIKNITLN